MRRRRAVAIGDAVARLTGHGVEIAWPDGTKVTGIPHDTDDYRLTARQHGYGADTHALCVEHELLHVALGLWLGVPSPVMMALRGIEPVSDEIAGYEEDAVLALQAYLRAVGVDLVERLSK